MTNPAPAQTPRRTSRRGFAALLLAIGALVGPALPAAAAPATSSTTTTETTADSSPEGPTVLVGVAGLRWTDVNPTTVPHLWSMIGSSSVGSINVRTGAGPVTCSLDAWLTLSAGQRESSAPPVVEPVPTDDPADPAEVTSTVDCEPLPTIDAGTGVSSSSVPGWSTLTTGPEDLVEEPADTTVDPETGAVVPRGPGALGTELAAAGVCSTAVGPGGAITLADSTGAVSRYVPTLDALSQEELAACDTVVIDQGELPESSPERAEALRELDRVLERLTSDLPRDSRVLVAGIADTPGAKPGLQVVVDWTASGSAHGWLQSESTRFKGLVQLTDLTATLAADAGISTAAFEGGAPLESGDDRRMSISRTVENRRYLGVLSDTAPNLMPAFVGLLIGALVIAVGATLWSRRAAERRAAASPSGPTAPLPPSPRGRRVLSAVLLLVASAPAASSLSTLARWWVSPAPTFALILSVSVATVVVALVAWFVSRVLPRSPWRLAAAVSGVTWLVLTVDGLTGTTLQQGSLLGPAPVLGARFYGFNNMTFAVYGAAALLLAGSIASQLAAHGRRRASLAVVVGVGVVTTVVDGWPAFGADFGGILALIPAFAILALLVAQVRITVRRILAVAAATIGVVVVVSVVDWAIPGTSSHLGGFVQRFLDGDALSMIATKAAGAWATVASVPGVLATVAVVATAFAALRPDVCRLPEVAAAYRAWPQLRSLVISLVVAAGIGSVLNDSGVIIAVMFVVVAIATVVASFLSESSVTVAAAVPTAVPADAPVPSASPTARKPRAPRIAGLSTDSGTIRRMPTTILAVGGGLLLSLLLAAAVVPTSGAAVAGDEVRRGTGAPVAPEGESLVVIGTSGLRWPDVASGTAPELRTLLTEGAGAAGDSLPTGAASRCPASGWLALSAGQYVRHEPLLLDDGTTSCAPVTTVATDGTTASSDEPVDTVASSRVATPATSVQVQGWQDMVDAQSRTVELGTLGQAISDAGICATAVGPRAALALADSDGTVARYQDLPAALAPVNDTFGCALTVVDAGDATPAALATIPGETAAERSTRYRTERPALVADVDATVGRVLDAVPDSATVLVVDVVNNPGARPALGVTMVRSSTSIDSDQPRFLTSSATRSDGIVRLLDVPPTILGALGVEVPAGIDTSVMTYGSPRPLDAASAADALADLTSRDQVRRQIYPYFVDYAGYAGLVLAAGCLLLAPVARRKDSRGWRIGRRVAEGAALVLASLPAAAFVSSMTSWWRFENPMLAAVAMSIGSTVVVAGLGARAPPPPRAAGGRSGGGAGPAGRGPSRRSRRPRGPRERAGP
ncbi:alkaline phosphatase family protein, partial [Oerskovia merdavium]